MILNYQQKIVKLPATLLFTGLVMETISGPDFKCRLGSQLGALISIGSDGFPVKENQF